MADRALKSAHIRRRCGGSFMFCLSFHCIFQSPSKQHCNPIEFLFAFHTAEILFFSIMTNLKFGCHFVQNHATGRIPGHRFILHFKQLRMTLDELCLLSPIITEIFQLFKRLPLKPHHFF